MLWNHLLTSASRLPGCCINNFLSLWPNFKEMKLLEGKTAVITGGSRGIGKGIALRFASEGANIALTNIIDNEEFADAIKFALEVPPEEKRKRMENMRKIISENNIYRWAGNIISELTALKRV